MFVVLLPVDDTSRVWRFTAVRSDIVKFAEDAVIFKVPVLAKVTPLTVLVVPSGPVLFLIC